MKKHIAIAVSLAVVFGAFYGDTVLGLFALDTSSLTKDPKVAEMAPEGLSLEFVRPTLSLPAIVSGESAVKDLAWKTFQDYRKFAEAHNLEGIKSLSYQISPTCLDSTKLDECYALMDGVIFFTEEWKQSDFRNVAFDDKQVVLSTDFMRSEPEAVPIKVLLLFTQTKDGSLKLLSLKYCSGEDKPGNICFDTDPETRDADGDGWWDDLETVFYK